MAFEKKLSAKILNTRNQKQFILKISFLFKYHTFIGLYKTSIKTISDQNCNFRDIGIWKKVPLNKYLMKKKL